MEGIPSVSSEGSKIEARVAEGKIDEIVPISSYLINPYYYGYSYVGHPFVPNLRLVRDAGINVKPVEPKLWNQELKVLVISVLNVLPKFFPPGTLILKYHINLFDYPK